MRQTRVNLLFLLGMLAVVLMGGALAPRVEAQSVEGVILRAPDHASPGDVVPAVGGFANSGRRDVRVAVDWYLVSRNSHRIHIGHGFVDIPAGQRARERFRLHIPERIRTGEYQLVMVVRNRRGVLDVDRTGILIR